jgi:hypothetical protein
MSPWERQRHLGGVLAIGDAVHATEANCHHLTQDSVTDPPGGAPLEGWMRFAARPSRAING